MNYKCIFYFTVLSLYLCFSNFQCYDCDEFIDDRYEYIIDRNSSARSFSLSDTLILSLEIDSHMELKFSGDIYDNSNQYISYTFKIFELQPNQFNAIPARENFIVNGIKGEINFPMVRDFDVEVYDTCSSNRCELETSLIPQKNGFYGIHLSLSYLSDINSECITLSMEPKGFSEDVTSNAEILEELNIELIRIETSRVDMPKNNNKLYLFKVA